MKALNTGPSSYHTRRHAAGFSFSELLSKNGQSSRSGTNDAHCELVSTIIGQTAYDLYRIREALGYCHANLVFHQSSLPGCEMPIPPFDGITGAIPPIVGDPSENRANMSPFNTNAMEIHERFGFSKERRDIIRGWLDLRALLIQAGLTGFQWIDGSFVEDIEAAERRAPKDIDVLSFVSLSKSTEDTVLFLEKHRLLDRDFVKQTFRVDHLLIDLNTDPVLIVDFTRYFGKRPG